MKPFLLAFLATTATFSGWLIAAHHSSTQRFYEAVTPDPTAPLAAQYQAGHRNYPTGLYTGP